MSSEPTSAPTSPQPSALMQSDGAGLTHPAVQRMPALFVGHGTPMNAIEPTRYAQAWRALGALMPRPKAILCVSAHFLTRGLAVTAMTRPETIHDFGGFPQALFDVQYPAPGDPALAQRVADLLAPLPVYLDHQGGEQGWGLDHGSWGVLVHLYPEADIPVVQLSLDATQSSAWHLALARKLAPLRDEGVLVLGSGNIIHNLRLVQRHLDHGGYDWADRYSLRVRQALAAGDAQAVLAAMPEHDGGVDAQHAVPTPDHFWPLLYTIGLHQPGEPISFPVQGLTFGGAIDMASVQVG